MSTKYPGDAGRKANEEKDYNKSYNPDLDYRNVIDHVTRPCLKRDNDRRNFKKKKIYPAPPFNKKKF